MTVFEKIGTDGGFFEFPTTAGFIHLPFHVSKFGKISIEPKVLKHYYDEVLDENQLDDLEFYLNATGGKIKGQVKVL